MEELLIKAFDFGIRIVELFNYLVYENKSFALINRLLECGTGIVVCIRISQYMARDRQDNYIQAFKLTLEAEYLFELMVKTSVITENQSRPILSDCRSIKDEIGKLIYDQEGQI